MAVQQTDELLSVPQAAAALGIKVSTVRSWVLHKRIPYVKYGGKLVRFRQADIQNFIAARVIPAEVKQ